jgi:hypothetical protein
MDPEDQAEIEDMPLVSVSMKVKVLALSTAFILVVGLGLWTSSPLIIRCLEVVQEYADLSQSSEMSEDGPGENVESAGSSEMYSSSWGGPIHVIMSDGFEQENVEWRRRTSCRGTGTIGIYDGSMFLNLSKESNRYEFSRVWLKYGGDVEGDPWLFVGAEIRLKCSDDNGQESDITGGGMRCWGLTEGTTFPDNSILFVSNSPESDHPGLHVRGRIDGRRVINRPIIGVDISDWHNYTILWGPLNSTVLIDDVVVATLDETPIVPMAVYVQAGNTCFGEKGDWHQTEDIYMSYIDLEQDVWIQVESIRVDMSEEWYRNYSDEVMTKLRYITQLVDAAREKNLTTEPIQQLYAEVLNDWEMDGFVHASLYSDLVDISDDLGKMMNHIDELIDLFSTARKAIQEFVDVEGRYSRTFLYMNSYLDIAENARDRYDWETAIDYLMRIIQMSPEK